MYTGMSIIIMCRSKLKKIMRRHLKVIPISKVVVLTDSPVKSNEDLIVIVLQLLIPFLDILYTFAL